jgi:hypothetical protein
LRITIKQLETDVDRINAATDSPAKPFIEGVWQVGNYHLGEHCGGVVLHRVVSLSGGVKDVLQTGPTSKKELFNGIYAFLLGLEAK